MKLDLKDSEYTQLESLCTSLKTSLELKAFGYPQKGCLFYWNDDSAKNIPSGLAYFCFNDERYVELRMGYKSTTQEFSLNNCKLLAAPTLQELIRMTPPDLTYFLNEFFSSTHFQDDNLINLYAEKWIEFKKTGMIKHTIQED